MKTWEYLMMRGEHAPSRQELDEVGVNGWELVSYAVTAHHMGKSDAHILIFKRHAGEV